MGAFDPRQKWALISGEPGSGFVVTGPFDNEDEAKAYAASGIDKELLKGQTSWAVRLWRPLRADR